MSSINTTNLAPTITPFTNEVLLDELAGAKKDGITSVQDYITKLGTIIGDSVKSVGNAPILAPPSGLVSAADLTVKIALLQDALNQLQQQVSKLEIEGRLNDLEKNNNEQLKKIQKQIEEAQEAMRKQQEAEKKGTIFEAIGNWFKAAFDFVSAAFSIVAAIGYALTGNVVAAAGLFVSAAALIVSGTCNFFLAVDATMRAAGGSGFLSEDAKAGLNKTAEICGYIALAAGLISGIGAVTSTLRTAVGTATSQMATQGIKLTTKEALKMSMGAMKDALKELSKEAFGRSSDVLTKEAAKQFADQAMDVALREGSRAVMDVANEAAKIAVHTAIKESIKATFGPIYKAMAQLSLATAIGKAVTATTNAVGTMEVAKLDELAAQHQLEADKAEAAAKAFDAMITMLRTMIEQLQKEIEEMLDSAMQSVQAVYNAADEASSSMKDLFQFQTN